MSWYSHKTRFGDQWFGWYSGAAYNESLRDDPPAKAEPCVEEPRLSANERRVVERAKRELLQNEQSAELRAILFKAEWRFDQYLLAQEREQAQALLRTAGLNASADALENVGQEVGPAENPPRND